MSQMSINAVSQFKSGSVQAHLSGQLLARQKHKERLGDQITELAAHIHAATFRLLEMILEFDACEGWAGEGVLSCAHWLNWKCGMALGVARERVRVAHALKDLPKISQTFRKGKLSYSKVRAMTRVATRRNENYLLMIAHFGTASHVERLVRNYRSVKRNEALAKANEQHLQRELSWYVDDDGYWVIRGRLAPEAGSLVQQVLEQAMEEQYQELQHVPAGISEAGTDEVRSQFGAGLEEGEERRDAEPVEKLARATGNQSRSWPAQPVAWRRADALLRLARGYRSHSKTKSSAENYLVHIHTDMKTLKQDGAGAEAEIESGGMLCAETTRRLSCDAAVVQWLDKHDGQPLSAGRKSRTIPPAIRRALQRRDGGCRFPGCTASRFVDAHHIHHWADGGETSMENLLLLCTRHHHLVHEGGFGLQKLADGRVQFSNPAGKSVPMSPAGNSRGNADELFRLNHHRGIRITPKSSQSYWMGEKMDEQLAVEGLLFREESSSGRQ